jgi:LuxR family transcriptional regulator, maltose regulon positive regulatory protein
VPEEIRTLRTVLDTIVQTKLYIPAVPHSHVARLRLLVQLESALHTRLTLTTAPAGSGKTTLVSSWAREQADAVAWLGLDSTDNDPARFWSYVLHALHGLEPTGVAPLLAALRSPQPPPIEATLAALLNTLAAHPAPLALVPELHRRAAAWFAAQELIDAAIQHALAAEDHLLAARWIERAVNVALRSGDIAPLRGWLVALPEALVRARPQLAVGQL